MASTAVIVCVALAGCSRSGLFWSETSDDDGYGSTQGDSALGDAAPPTFDGAVPPTSASDAALPPPAGPDAAPTAPTSGPDPTTPVPTTDPPTMPPPTTPPPGCVPHEEVCNGVDDDCDGQIDELQGVPCPGGGTRYCIAGRLSECPRRCETCMPGSERVCFLSYCTFWALQTCTADGRGFSACREETVPNECRHAVHGTRKTRELEQCCLDNGYCCMDDFDLDEDGITREMIGQCDEVRCD
jgi:hypothetical protein